MKNTPTKKDRIRKCLHEDSKIFLRSPNFLSSPLSRASRELVPRDELSPRLFDPAPHEWNTQEVDEKTTYQANEVQRFGKRGCCTARSVLTRRFNFYEASFSNCAVQTSDVAIPVCRSIRMSLISGVYEEVKRIEPEFTFSGRSNTGNKAYIILGFKSLDTNFSSSLERSWRDWTGARSIYLNLHNEFDLAR